MSADVTAIARTLDELVEEEAAVRSGPAPRVAVRLQLEQLRRRLRSFATWQAAQARAGWTIDPDLVEVRVEATLDVDGEPFVVTGRIDRVDRHPTAGARLLDYKSAEQSITPDEAACFTTEYAKAGQPLFFALGIGVAGPNGVLAHLNTNTKVLSDGKGVDHLEVSGIFPAFVEASIACGIPVS